MYTADSAEKHHLQNYSSKSASKSILAGFQYIFIQNILPQHRPLSN